MKSKRLGLVGQLLSFLNVCQMAVGPKKGSFVWDEKASLCAQFGPISRCERSQGFSFFLGLSFSLWSFRKKKDLQTGFMQRFESLSGLPILIFFLLWG